MNDFILGSETLKAEMDGDYSKQHNRWTFLSNSHSSGHRLGKKCPPESRQLGARHARSSQINKFATMNLWQCRVRSKEWQMQFFFFCAAGANMHLCSTTWCGCVVHLFRSFFCCSNWPFSLFCMWIKSCARLFFLLGLVVQFQFNVFPHMGFCEMDSDFLFDFCSCCLQRKQLFWVCDAINKLQCYGLNHIRSRTVNFRCLTPGDAV